MDARQGEPVVILSPEIMDRRFSVVILEDQVYWSDEFGGGMLEDLRDEEEAIAMFLVWWREKRRQLRLQEERRLDNPLLPRSRPKLHLVKS
jgi:hypothetical protein